MLESALKVNAEMRGQDQTAQRPDTGKSNMDGAMQPLLDDAIFEAMPCEYKRGGTDTRAGNLY